ncbi:hypothetical protein AB0M39_40205 [Streptomyces sp. NPDC051907]|uniref:hypothetical protein n=1 Tax=Streptomyces sp. NPDC051907 TaxID=3155284 RepID=UPI00343E9CE7
MKHPEFELGPRRLIPALPETDPELGEIRWGQWEQALCVTHIPGDCETCEYPGPMRNARGLTLHQDPPHRPLLRRSRIAEGQRPVWGQPVTPEPRWVYTHWARRCPHCDEMEVWRMKGWVRIHYHPFTEGRKVPPQDGTLF